MDREEPNRMTTTIENYLRRAFEQLDTVQRALISIADEESSSILGDISNQLDQRASIDRVSLDGTNLGELADVKARLRSKIDSHVTHLCRQRILDRLDSLDDRLDALRSIYERAGETCQDGETGLSALSIEDLRRRTESRPSFAELFSWLDEELTFLETDLAARRRGLSELEPSSDQETIRELTRIWKVSFAVRQRWAWIRFCVSAFLENAE